ncbi:hypothetical protein LWI28_015564 [Acer negundo]|uniref:Uncharacterized protein n=1 Tax=Acer negundo TaxID=4023 RepID=A0AAD5IEE3_ACENE|nr:hypothetical protein LWI28_015564 [Acer negundo]
MWGVGYNGSRVEIDEAGLHGKSERENGGHNFEFGGHNHSLTVTNTCMIINVHLPNANDTKLRYSESAPGCPWVGRGGPGNGLSFPRALELLILNFVTRRALLLRYCRSIQWEIGLGAGAHLFHIREGPLPAGFEDWDSADTANFAKGWATTL